MHLTLPPRDLARIALVVLAWGSNFTAMKLALEELPPALFVGLRFAILLPLLAVLPRPRASWRQILGVGLFINTGQFLLLFSGMAAGMSAGLAALILQAQAPLTILLAVFVFSERTTQRQILGIALAATGHGHHRLGRRRHCDGPGARAGVGRSPVLGHQATSS